MTIRSFLAAFAALLLLANPLGAHPMPRSLVLLDIREDRVDMELRLPADRLEIGFGQALAGDARARVRMLRGELARYLAQHVAATGFGGDSWSVEVREVGVSADDPAHEVFAHLRLLPPPGASPRGFLLRYDAIQHQLLTHRALVVVRSDWAGGLVGEQPEILGELGYGATTLEVQRGAGSVRSGFAAVLRLGMRHIAEGTDHLLFLLVLLLPASLTARRGRWAEYAGTRRSLGGLVRIVTAFTVGHSLTLIVGAIGGIRFPGGPVEVLIALSILVSAVHALRPLFPGREPVVAAGFGLVHGLAFAGAAGELGLSTGRMALSILGFNVGIELMQLLVVAVSMPWLLLLARSSWCATIRVVGAAAAGFAALAWGVERSLGWTAPVAGGAPASPEQGFWIAAGLATLALAATLWSGWRRVAAA